MKNSKKIPYFTYLMIFTVILFTPNLKEVKAGSFYMAGNEEIQTTIGAIIPLIAIYDANSFWGYYDRIATFRVDNIQQNNQYQIYPNPTKGFTIRFQQEFYSSFYAITPGLYEVSASYTGGSDAGSRTTSNKIKINVVEPSDKTPRLLALTIPQGNIIKGQPSLGIKVQTYPVESGVKINFSVNTQGFLPKNFCITLDDGSCTIDNLPSHKHGKFIIKYSSLPKYEEGSLTIEILEKDYSVKDIITCPSPTVLVNGVCQCLSPNKIENGECIAVSTYKFLAPFGEENKTFDPAQEYALSKYLNMIIKIAIGIAAVLAVIMIVMGGIQYMTSDLVSNKEDGRKRMTNAVLGLIVALGAYLILFTINPNLLNIEPKIDKVALGYVGEQESPTPLPDIPKGSFEQLGINCPKSGGRNQTYEISYTFKDKVTYSQFKKGTIDMKVPTLFLDCSSFVTQVWKCAGLPNPGGWTPDIFKAGSKGVFEVKSNTGTVINNNYELKEGDLLGWPDPDGTKGGRSGHVVMYIGNGKAIEVHVPTYERKGPAVYNKAISIRPANYYGNQIKWLKKAPPYE